MSEWANDWVSEWANDWVREGEKKDDNYNTPISAMCLAVTIEALVFSLDKWHNTGEVKQKYGYASYLSWFVFGAHVFAAICYLVGSRKRKGSRAATVEFEREDRPVQIGRGWSFMISVFTLLHCTVLWNNYAFNCLLRFGRFVIIRNFHFYLWKTKTFVMKPFLVCTSLHDSLQFLTIVSF